MIFNTTTGAAKKLPVLNGSYPADTTVNAGTGAVFRVLIAQDGMPSEYTYQWYVNDAAVSGATSAEYIRDTTSDRGLYHVYCVVTNRAGSVISRGAVLTVQALPVLDSGYPADITVAKHTAATCKVSVSGGYPEDYTYQWYVDGVAISGANEASGTFTPTVTGTWELYCEVTNAAGTVTSRTATVTVTDLYLYNAGDLCTPVTGGWVTTAGDIVITYDSDSISFGYSDTTTAGEYGCLYTVNPVDLTDYSTLRITVNPASVGYSPYLLVGTDNTSRNQNASTVVAKTEITSAGSKTWTLDVSALTGSYYVGFYWNESEGTIHEISLS